MSYQYLSDSNGVPTGVFIPIKDWDLIKDKVESLLEDDWYDDLSQDAKDKIELSLEQADNGDTISHKEVKKRMRAKIEELRKR